MNWLAARLHELDGRHAAWRANGGDHAVRAAFFSELGQLLQEVAARQGVLAAFAAHDGLLVDCSGQPDTVEALAAMAPLLLEPSQHIAEQLELGPLQQTLIVGSQRKIALIAVGEIAIGILSPTEVHLGALLSRANPEAP